MEYLFADQLDKRFFSPECSFLPEVFFTPFSSTKNDPRYICDSAFGPRNEYTRGCRDGILT